MQRTAGSCAGSEPCVAPARAVCCDGASRVLRANCTSVQLEAANVQSARSTPAHRTFEFVHDVPLCSLSVTALQRAQRLVGGSPLCALRRQHQRQRPGRCPASAPQRFADRRPATPPSAHCTRSRSSTAASGSTNTVFTRSGITAPGADLRGLRTYLRRVQSTATVPDVRARLCSAARIAASVMSAAGGFCSACGQRRMTCAPATSRACSQMSVNCSSGAMSAHRWRARRVQHALPMPLARAILAVGKSGALRSRTPRARARSRCAISSGVCSRSIAYACSHCFQPRAIRVNLSQQNRNACSRAFAATRAVVQPWPHCAPHRAWGPARW